MRRSPESRFTVESFEAGAIDPDRFDHEAHIYVAWLYLKTFECDEAIQRFDAALRRLTRKIGAASKYNAMITWLFLKLIAERSHEDESWLDFRARNTDLFEGFPRAA